MGETRQSNNLRILYIRCTDYETLFYSRVRSECVRAFGYIDRVDEKFMIRNAYAREYAPNNTLFIIPGRTSKDAAVINAR